MMEQEIVFLHRKNKEKADALACINQIMVNGIPWEPVERIAAIAIINTSLRSVMNASGGFE